MSNENDYSFCIMPGKKTRHIAGPFDVKTRKPHYEIDISIPAHVCEQVEINQILLGTPESCQLAWDIKNNSSWPAFVIIKKDGDKM